jgi:hypothetical protein
MNIETLLKFEGIVYWVVSIVIIVLTTIKQFNKHEKKNKLTNKEIIDNLHHIDKQNIKILGMLEIHSQVIETIKKDIGTLDNRVSKLENSYGKLFEKVGGQIHDKH